MNKFHLDILTPTGKYLSKDIDFLNVRSSEYNLGIYANHTPLISTLVVSKMIIRDDGNENVYAIGGGVIYIEKDKVTLLLNSVERADEIDLQRALAAKDRAENRLNDPNGKYIREKAKSSLARALNRISIAQNRK